MFACFFSSLCFFLSHRLPLPSHSGSLLFVNQIGGHIAGIPPPSALRPRFLYALLTAASQFTCINYPTLIIPLVCTLRARHGCRCSVDPFRTLCIRTNKMANDLSNLPNICSRKGMQQNEYRHCYTCVARLLTVQL